MVSRTSGHIYALICLLLAVASTAVAADWKDVRTDKVGELEVTLSAPVLVLRSEGYCWFPTMTQLAGGELLAVMSNYHDDHVEKATAALCWSADGGLTWSEPKIGLYSDAALRLPSGDQLLIPYYLRPKGAGVMSAPYQLVPKGKREAKEMIEGLTITGWPRPDKSFSPQLGLSGFVFNGNTVEIKDGHLAMLYGYFKDTKRYSLVAAESQNGVAWKVRAVLADETCPLPGAEGPCESATCRLKDGRLMCVFRLASNVSYGQTISGDDGKTWSKPQNLPAGVGSVQPALAALPSGTLVLSGGRPGLYAWFNTDGSGKDWQRVDLLAHHNACQEKDAIPNPASGTSAYTELLRLDDTHVLCIYDRLARGWSAIPKGSGETNSVWVVRMTVK
ncbi:MAG: sialidase family protein [Pirellulaceae bacterium]